MSPEFMSGALRNHKQTTFSRGAPQTPSWSTSERMYPPPPQRDQPTALSNIERVEIDLNEWRIY